MSLKAVLILIRGVQGDFCLQCCWAPLGCWGLTFWLHDAAAAPTPPHPRAHKVLSGRAWVLKPRPSLGSVSAGSLQANSQSLSAQNSFKFQLFLIKDLALAPWCGGYRKAGNTLRSYPEKIHGAFLASDLNAVFSIPARM